MKRIVLILTVLLIVGGCTDPTPAPQPPTPSAVPPTPTVDFSGPESVGRTYLSAWEAEDYTTMYTLLSPSLRAGLTSESFTEAYLRPLRVTTSVSVTLTPRTLGMEEGRAWVEFEEIWHTALFGALSSPNRLNLVQEEGQWWVDWRRETIWPELAGGNSFAIEYQIPPRANIYDHTGAGLAVPSTIVTVGVIPNQIEDEAAILGALSQVLGLTVEEIRAIYADQPAHWYVPIADITGEESLAYDDLLNLPGISRRERAGRLYPLDGVGSQVIGWVSPVPAEKAESYRRRGYRGDEWVGISGLEAWGERILAGRNGGRLYVVDAEGNYVRGVAEHRPERGRSIYTTIDRQLQQQAEAAISNRRGAIVAIDVKSGAIRAMASGPSFDNNIFIRTTDAWTLQATLSDPRQPLFNRATQGLYPTGSVFKIITLAAALESGLSPQHGFYCPGYWDGLGAMNRKYCWLKTGHGNVSLQDALTASCNVTFYEVGAILDGIDQNLLPTYGRAFGLGQETGLLEMAEAAGIMPDPEWKRSTYQEGWATGDAVNLAIGQGFLVTTPLQMTRAIAAVANGGTLYRPYLVERVAEGNRYPEEVTQPEAMGQLPISAENLAIVQAAMRGVTTRPLGTATHRFQGLGVAVAGKTGTAEQPIEGELPHSWFAGYFPADDPEIAMVVMVENAGEGSTVAAPLFRQVVEGYYGWELTPLPEVQATPVGD